MAENDAVSMKDALGQAFASYYREICKADRNFSPGKISLEEKGDMATAMGYVSADIAISDPNAMELAAEAGKRGVFAEIVKKLDGPGFPLWPMIRTGSPFDFETALASIMEWHGRSGSEPSFDETSRQALSEMAKPKFIACMIAVNGKDEIEMQTGIVIDSPYILDEERDRLMPFHKWCARYFEEGKK